MVKNSSFNEEVYYLGVNAGTLGFAQDIYPDDLDNLLDNKYVWYDYCYDRKIRVGNQIRIRIYFEKGKYPYMLFSSTLAFLFEDQNHNNWEQPFFYEQEKVYPPYGISYKEYRQRITVDDAYDCFERPWLW